MQEINLKELINSKVSNFETKFPRPIRNLILGFLNKVFHISEINNFIIKNTDKYSFEFIDELFETLDFSYYVAAKDKIKIPAEGKLIVVANHPLGALDGLALVRAVGEVRKDVKIVANDLLLNLTNIKDLFLPFDLYSFSAQKRNLMLIEEALQKEEAVIFFPAAEVSRLTVNGVRDKKWQKGAIRLAKKFQAPVLPIFVKGRNSLMFYLLSWLNKGFSTFLLPHEMFKQRGNNITLQVGNVIGNNVFRNSSLNEELNVKLLKKHLYNIGKNKKEIFETEKTIIHPLATKSLKLELSLTKKLGLTRDGKHIFLGTYPTINNLLKEIARLREITYRKVGEGTGNKSDVDNYDKFYKHIILWDDNNLDIVGSYRLGLCSEILNETSTSDSLYTSLQFKFTNEMLPILQESLEVGRSFIQQRYWNSNALDYLWQGIGALLNELNNVRYLYGTVSISDNYPEDAKNLIIEYYKKWYGDKRELATAKNKYVTSQAKLIQAKELLTGKTPEEDFKNIKNALRNFNLSVPVLLRKYTDICEYGGVTFLDFGVDYSFGNSVDCFILVDLHQIKKEFAERYLNQKSFVKTKELESV
jgi:putative hemolysin